eukprot:TRINITY_DN60914_c0_g1_i1.p1 TRINITY_DN60914_c0_g1~~TRINITY_DN60914_c0_g1_i1.p1  ORF type:complete len:269 (+),score=21.51 TRINITY_DN60914_c0_g1_i1:116-922(+)
MVFFVYVGGGWQGLACLLGSVCLSMLLNQGNWFSEPDWERVHLQARYKPRRHRSTEQSDLFSNGIQFVVCFLIFCTIMGGLFTLMLRYAWFNQLRAVQMSLRGAGKVKEVLRERLAAFLDCFTAWDFPGADDGRQRDRATPAQVQAIPVETFHDEVELSRWSVSRLREELRRTQRLADFGMKYSGGSESREVHNLLKHGGSIEKPELVHAVLRAHGGDSGTSCTICLASYETGASLRVLPCGHRFHTSCVDQWLLEQSNTCPLCSKRL